MLRWIYELNQHVISVISPLASHETCYHVGQNILETWGLYHIYIQIYCIQVYGIFCIKHLIFFKNKDMFIDFSSSKISEGGNIYGILNKCTGTKKHSAGTFLLNHYLRLVIFHTYVLLVYQQSLQKVHLKSKHQHKNPTVSNWWRAF